MGDAAHLTLGFRECWSLKALMRQTTPLDELLVYSNPGSQQQMRLPRVEATWGLARSLSSADLLLHGQSNELSLGATTRRLNDMMTTPFSQHILIYEPLRGYTIPKFVMYDRTYDLFDHLMHYRQMMMLDIGNDELLCKVFSASIQGIALTWFHWLFPNSVHSFREMLEAFVAYYLCLAR